MKYREHIYIVRRGVLLVLLAFSAGILSAGHTFHFFPLQPVIPSFTSEIHSTVNRFEFLNANIAPPLYPWSDGFSDRILLNLQLGIEVPIVGGDSEKWSWYAGLPLAADLMNDFFEGSTAPVMNTDYWFGIRLEALYRLPPGWPRNISLRLLPFFHESTHIGDEVSLGISYEHPDDFYRINVSYEAWEITVGIDEWDNHALNAFNLRLGMSGRWNQDGYYNIPPESEIGTDFIPSDVIPSRGNMEYFGQFHAVVVRGFPSIGNWVFQGGVEIRNRILYEYFTSEPEKRVWTVNTTLGWYNYPENAAGRRLGFYMKFLAGQNPHGQFREQNGYFVFGAGFSLGM